MVKKNGLIRLSTLDFEKSAKQWLKAKDEWKDFHRNDKKAIEDNYWFGTYTYKPKNRWGYLTATFYGSQNGKGQFHKNSYTKKLLKSGNITIAQKVGEESRGIASGQKWGNPLGYLIVFFAKWLPK